MNDETSPIAELERMRVEFEQEYRELRATAAGPDPEDRAAFDAFYDRRLTAIAQAIDALMRAGRANARFGEVAERIDNLVNALKLPLPPAMQVAGLRGTLPDVLREARAAAEAR